MNSINMPGKTREDGHSQVGTLQQPAPDAKQFARWFPVAVIVLTALIYVKSVFGDFTNFDDDVFILENKLITDLSWEGIGKIFTSIKSGKYMPLTSLSFAIEHHFFGFNSLVVHLDNVLLHLASTWLVYRIVLGLGGSAVSAMVVSLLFGIHPMHVEEVAWASERKDVLHAFFYLLSLLYYLKYISATYKARYYALVLIFFVMSLLSKSEAITLPLLLIAVDVYKQRKMNARVITEKIPLFVFAGVIVMLSIMSTQADGGLGQVSTASYGFINRIFLFTTIPAFYVVKLFVPFQLSVMHYYPDMHEGMLPWMYYASLPFIILVGWLALRRTSLRRQTIFGVCFFIITICIMPQLVSVGPALTPERYSYIPYIGLFFIAGEFFSKVIMTKWKTAAIVVFSGFVVMFGIQSWLRIDVWKSSDTLLTDAIDKNADVADCSFFYWLRANHKISVGDVNGAIEDYSVAITQHPGFLEAHSNRGAAYFQAGDMRSAILDYDKAIRISPSRPKSYYNRAASKASIGDLEGALSDYNFFLKLVPNDDKAIADRGMVRFGLKDTPGAVEDWKAAAGLGNQNAALILQQIGSQ